MSSTFFTFVLIRSMNVTISTVSLRYFKFRISRLAICFMFMMLFGFSFCKLNVKTSGVPTAPVVFVAYNNVFLCGSHQRFSLPLYSGFYWLENSLQVLYSTQYLEVITLFLTRRIKPFHCGFCPTLIFEYRFNEACQKREGFRFREKYKTLWIQSMCFV